MARSIRRLIASTLLGGACLLPAQSAFADDKPANIAVPAEKKMTARQLHDHLAKGSGWVRFKTDAGTNNGTAWIIDKDKKLMITNAHVVEGKDVVQMIFPEWKDGKLVREESAYDNVAGVKATVIDRDESRDLALLVLESLPETSHAMKLSNSEPEEGDNVRTIGGFTLGGEGLVWGAVRGEVRTVGPVLGWRGNAKVRKISTDAPINGGNSGGPLVDEAGDVVGVNASYQSNARNVSHHISIDELKSYMKVAGPLTKPETAEQFLLRGTRRLDVLRNDLAIQDFSAAIKKNDKLAGAFHLRGKAFLATSDAGTALEDLNTALKLDGGNADFHVTRGRAYFSVNKNDEARLDFTTAIRIDPSNGDAYNCRGAVEYRAGKFPEACADFGRAIEKDGTNPRYFANRADAFSELGKHLECAKDRAVASDLAPWSAEFAESFGWACINAGKFEACLQGFQLAFKNNPTPRNIVLVAIGQRLTGDVKAALKSINEGLSKFDENAKSGDLYMAYYNRGMIHTALKNPKQAIEDLNKAVEVSEGKNMFAFVERAKANEAAGNTDAAATDYAAAEKLGWKSDKPTEVVAAPTVSILGTWKTSFECKLGKITQVLTFQDDGTWFGTTTLTTEEGTDSIDDSGTYTLAKGELAFKGKATGNVTRKILKMDAKKLEVEIKEVATDATFTKVK